MHWKVPTYRPLTQLSPGLSCYIPRIGGGHTAQRAHGPLIRIPVAPHSSVSRLKGQSGGSGARGGAHPHPVALHQHAVSRPTEYRPLITCYDILFPLKPKKPV
ncbi:hypothetical protein [Marinoscillum luteum]|uniref:Uncharacterized protein n=1 Tax=Marinoscillum luteum TaxID=861051 RepID=A0ABW7NAK5_9BACT